MKLTRRHRIIIVVASVVVLIATTLVGIGINHALFSASGFVTQYLNALSRHDAASALSMPGVGDALPADADTTLLRGSAMGELTDIRILKVSGSNERTNVTASYLVGGENATGTFVVTRLGNTFGIFESWGFAELPVARTKVSVWHDASFTVGDSGQIDLRSTPSGSEATGWEGTGTFLLFAPGNYIFTHNSEWLTATKQSLNIESPGDTAEIVVDVQANKKFNQRVQEEVDTYLDECVTQHVLQPTGCPFGYETGNRIVGEPSWEIVTYPPIAVEPRDGSWQVVNATGTVKVTGEVQSLYDGTISPLEEEVPVVLNILITITADGQLAIELR
ncbi:hypothetical protein M2119_000299 [Aurantimicrobium minutum]|uniref:hypothetical protein n=1 Tax=Aurantimicrobium minutum TaxID=708131 RepID=UPI0024738429|nr:hypothetical protein [Aurantimicrobium minutum]MDH6532062.1 hypothetical protein [Aurantimicrobium minutum]